MNRVMYIRSTVYSGVPRASGDGSDLPCMKVMLESSPLEENDCQKLRNYLAFPVLKRG